MRALLVVVLVLALAAGAFAGGWLARDAMDPHPKRVVVEHKRDRSPCYFGSNSLACQP